MSELIELDEPSIGLSGVIALHSTRLGPAFGGIRRRVYADEAAMRADACALAEAMSLKCALARVPAGGGKTVLQVLEGADVEAIYDAVGDAVQELGGRYVCGPDLGTGRAELDRIRAKTAWVNPAENDAGASTAAGVYAGMRAVWRFCGIEPTQSTVAIQGLGAVGLALARLLLKHDVRVLGSDVDAARLHVPQTAGVEIVEPDAILGVKADVFAPCALGGVLTVDAVQQLRCRAVCGSANNQLDHAAVADALLAAGITHAPDIIVSSGAVTEGVLTIGRPRGLALQAEVDATIASLETVAYEVLVTANADGRPPDAVARERAAAMV